MARNRTSSDPRRPRTFTPPPPTRPRRNRRPLGWPAEGWRERIAPAITRAFCAVAFAGFGAFEVRFGDAALVIASLSMAAFVAAIVYVAVKMRSDFAAGVLAPDVLAIALTPAALWVASNIEVSDVRLGGNTGHFLMAALAVSSIGAITMIVSAVVNLRSPDRSALGALAGGFTIVAIFGGGTRFAAGELPDGVSLAWMAAAALTLFDGLVNPHARSTLRIAGVFGFAVTVAITGAATAGNGISNSANAGIAYLLALGTCAALIRLPVWTRRLSRWEDHMMTVPPDEPDGRSTSEYLGRGRGEEIA